MSHTNYPYAATRPVDLKNVSVTNGFWKKIIDLSRSAGLPALLTEYENRPVVRNFLDAAAGRPRATEGNGSNHDEFLFKALEACNYYFVESDTDSLRSQYERIRDIVLAVQEEDGYLNTLAIQTNIPHHSKDTRQELYSGGHLMQAGIAEKRILGQDILFESAKRYVDCLVEAYGLDGINLNLLEFRGKWPDHPNIETALVDLYRETSDDRYLKYCKAILDFGEYGNRTQMLNHAVCEMLHVAGATDYYLETGDKKTWDATLRLWDDLQKKIYITGGLGSTHRGTTLESVGKEFSLNNDQAYAETCASISLVFWSWKLFLATAESKYVDMLERTLYNGVLSGISEDGLSYFYENPLEYRLVTAEGSASTENEKADFLGIRSRRTAYHHCSCCPPNVHRLFASIQQYIYSVDSSSIWVNLFIGSRMEIELNENRISLEQKTEYPAEGNVKINLGMSGESSFSIKLRIPAWCADFTIAVNGNQEIIKDRMGYVTINRIWKDGDSIHISFRMEPMLIRCHPKNIANYEKLVIARGPLIYCLEGDDNPEIDVFSVVLPTDIKFKKCEIDTLDGVVGLTGKALVRDDSSWDVEPYQNYIKSNEPELSPAKITAIPYFAWANRKKSSMVTALPYEKR